MVIPCQTRFRSVQHQLSPKKPKLLLHFVSFPRFNLVKKDDCCINTFSSWFILYPPPKFNIDTKHDGLENVWVGKKNNLWLFRVSMWVIHLVLSASTDVQKSAFERCCTSSRADRSKELGFEEWGTGWLVGWLVVWLVGWLVAWLLGCLVGWLVGWSVKKNPLAPVCFWMTYFHKSSDLVWKELDIWKVFVKRSRTQTAGHTLLSNGRTSLGQATFLGLDPDRIKHR